MEIRITCYNKTEVWNSRQKAINFYRTCVNNSDGSERERYTNILMQLFDGKNNCKDLEF